MAFAPKKDLTSGMANDQTTRSINNFPKNNLGLETLFWHIHPSYFVFKRSNSHGCKKDSHSGRRFC